MEFETDTEARDGFLERNVWWVNGQIIGMLAFLGRTGPSSAASADHRQANWNSVLRTIFRLLTSIEPCVADAVQEMRLPLPILEQLYRLTEVTHEIDDDLQQSLDELVDALELPFEMLSYGDVNSTERNEYYKTLRKAQSIADVILHTSVSASGLLNVIDDLVNERDHRLDIMDDSDDLYRLQEALDGIRPTRLSHNVPSKFLQFSELRQTHRQLHCADEIGKQLSSLLPLAKDSDYATVCIEDVLHCLFQRILHWFLAISPSATAGHQYVPTAFPVSIDVIFDDSGHMDSAQVEGGTRVDISEWLKPREVSQELSVHVMKYRDSISENWSVNTFEYASYAAKMAWSKEHVGLGEERFSGRRARVVFDFSIADAIAERLFSEVDSANGKLTLAGPSMELYACSAVVNRLIGRESVLNSLATGELESCPIVSADVQQGGAGITKSSDDKQRLVSDMTLKAVGGIVEKTGCAYLLHVYDKLVIAGLDQLSQEEHKEYQMFRGDNRGHQSLSVVPRNRLSSALEAAVPGFLSQEFIRVSDLVTARAATDPAKVRLAQHLIMSSTSPIVNLLETHTDIAPCDVHAAAKTIERDSPFYVHFQWSEIRTGVFEEDERFLRTLWDITGAPYELYIRLAACDDPAEAAKLITVALTGTWEGNNRQPRRGQDLLVVIGANHLLAAGDFTYESSTYGKRRNAYRPLSLKAIYPHLEAALAVSRDDQLRKCLGETRLVLVHESESARPKRRFDERRLERNTDEHWVYQGVNCFQFGATRGQLSRVCNRMPANFGDSPMRIDNALKALLECGAIGYCHETRQYFSVNHFGCPQLPRNPIHCGTRLEDMADALSPPGHRTFTGTEGCEAYRPHLVHERQYYARMSRIWVGEEKAFLSHLNTIGIPEYEDSGQQQKCHGNRAGRRNYDSYGGAIGVFR